MFKLNIPISIQGDNNNNDDYKKRCNIIIMKL